MNHVCEEGCLCSWIFSKSKQHDCNHMAIKLAQHSVKITCRFSCKIISPYILLKNVFFLVFTQFLAKHVIFLVIILAHIHLKHLYLYLGKISSNSIKTRFLLSCRKLNQHLVKIICLLSCNKISPKFGKNTLSIFL